ncbi:MauE/DoxX family redox-associated membrane protein [Pedobacter sp. SL55]|uniref:DoxX family protein n=1 Tax=Pedobacter sp. SL55 TaxID=2995161 RepID=UPI002271D5D0|nr:DoxX family membrane protein [Pedobacter sp. SL55]WAC39015.1 DoxX family membrane protein [Pedobacter sp. SL55]
MHLVTTSIFQKSARILLGTFMVLAGIGHLTFQRKEFQAQVPNWVPLHKDTTVVLSGIAEIMLGLAMLLIVKQRPKVGIVLALFFVAVFPGNVAQYLNQRDAFGLNTDRLRLLRLFFQSGTYHLGAVEHWCLILPEDAEKSLGWQFYEVITPSFHDYFYNLPKN